MAPPVPWTRYQLLWPGRVSPKMRNTAPPSVRHRITEPASPRRTEPSSISGAAMDRPLTMRGTEPVMYTSGARAWVQ